VTDVIGEEALAEELFQVVRFVVEDVRGAGALFVDGASINRSSSPSSSLSSSQIGRPGSRFR